MLLNPLYNSCQTNIIFARNNDVDVPRVMQINIEVFGRSPGLHRSQCLPADSANSGRDYEIFLLLTVAGTAPGFHGIPY